MYKMKNDSTFRCINFILYLIICIIHFVFYFFIKQTEFENILDAFESSPLFDFSLDTSCGIREHIIFHVWEGRKEYSSRTDISGYSYTDIHTVDRTVIDKINGYYFCYTNISYKDLLYNDQIVKEGETCPEKYPKDCGIIDTLNQHLCIKNEEKCPLYDIRIGEPKNKNAYINERNNSGIFYNNENYDEPNKKIIGKLILSDGQPCYKLNEKLWRKFDSQESAGNNLECEFELNGVKTDNRYSNQGDITYKKLYEILPKDTWIELELDKKIKNEYVSLYKREIFGIDKECDKKSSLNPENLDIVRKNQKMESTCMLVESILMFILTIALLISVTMEECYYYVLLICILLTLICVICQGVFLGRIIKYDLSYVCSDEITNEILRIENLNTGKSITYTGVNLGFDIFFILFSPIYILIDFIIDKFQCLKSNNNPTKNLGNNNANQYNNEKPVREVIVNNEKPPVSNDFLKPGDNNNNLNQKFTNPNLESKPSPNPNPNSTPNIDLGVPPPLEQGYSSNANVYNS